MTSDQVKARVERAIGDQWDRSNLHHVNLRRSLMEPRQLNFVWVDGSRHQKLWLVLTEVPGAEVGYAMVYDEKSDAFGLAQFADGHEPCCLGIYGDFFAAFEAM